MDTFFSDRNHFILIKKTPYDAREPYNAEYFGLSPISTCILRIESLEIFDMSLNEINQNKKALAYPYGKSFFTTQKFDFESTQSAQSAHPPIKLLITNTLTTKSSVSISVLIQAMCVDSAKILLTSGFKIRIYSYESTYPLILYYL